VRRRHAPLVGRRGVVLLLIGAAGLAAAIALELTPAGLVPRGAGARTARRIFTGALAPALRYETNWVPDGTPPLLVEVARATWRTLLFAAGAMSLALVAGLPLGVLASDSWWSPEAFGGGRLRVVARPLQLATRVFIACLRSVHEVMWAVLFLAALGLNTFAAVVAIAVPFSGTLAKVFSEMLDEAPRHSAAALRGLGASPLQVFSFGLLPRALPDMVAYAFYRFECAVRSSAVLGFFGYPTLGYHLSLAFEEGRYREMWTVLYTLLALVLLLEAWSGALRRRFVA
jgi:phosphonate transport system permease protein